MGPGRAIIIKPIIKSLNSLKQMTGLSVFVSTCKGCGNYLVLEDERLLCRQCKEWMRRAHHRWSRGINCQLCGRLMENGDYTCGNCNLHPPLYSKHRSWASYHGLVRELLLMYKYGGMERLKNILIDCYVELYNEEIQPCLDGGTGKAFDYIIPVPPDRGRKREYSTLTEIARMLSRRLGITLSRRNLVKVKETDPQAELTRAKRLRNLDRAFELRQPGKIKHKRILLIDDVYTTGTTIEQCTKLLNGPAAEVVALTLARS